MTHMNRIVYPLLKLAIPLSITGLLQSSVFFLETLFLAHLNSKALAAGALVGWLFGTITYFLNGALSAINILVAHEHGAKNDHAISLIVRDGLWLSVLLAIPAMLLFWNMSSLFLLMGQDKATVFLAEPYLHSLTWGILPTFMMFALLEFLIGLGHVRIILIFSLLCVVLNVFLSFALIFGKFGMPKLGISGAGWGETISSVITVVILLTYLFTHRVYQHYFYFLFKATKKHHFFDLLRIGVPTGIMYSIEVTFFLALTAIMGTFSSLAMAANQIALQYMETLMQVIFSIAQGTTVRIGHLLGAGEKVLAEKTGYVGILISVLFMFVVGLCYWIFPTSLISIDFDVHSVKNREITHLAVQFLSICAIFQMFEATRIALFGALRGLKDTRFTLLISFLSFWGIALPLGYAMASRLHMDGAGLWWGMVISSIVSVPLLVWRYRFKMSEYSASSYSVL